MSKPVEFFKHELQNVFSNNKLLPVRLLNWTLFIFIILILVIRLYNIQSPALDRTGWKEIDYIAISQNFVNNNYNFFKPAITWPAEPPRVTAMEFPLVPYMASLLYPVFGFNVYTVRLITLLAFLGLILAVFALMQYYFGELAALFASFFAGIFPLMHTFNNFLFSEPTMILFSVLSVYYFSKWMDRPKTKNFVLSVVCFTLAVLLKLEPLYLLLIFFGLYFRKYSFQILKYTTFIFFVLLSIILPVLWYGYDYYLTLHSIDVFGIFKGHDKLQTLTMLSTTSWWRTMAIRLYVLAGGIIGLPFVLLGIVVFVWLRKGLVLFLYLAAILCYFFLVAEGNIDGLYRQLTIVPAIAGFAGVGLICAVIIFYQLIKYLSSSLIGAFSKSNILLVTGVAVVLFLIVAKRQFIFQNNPSEPFHKEEWRIAEQMKQFVSHDQKIITSGTYTMHIGGNDLSPVLYYYTGTQGWTLQEGNRDLATIEKLINKGAEYFAAYNIKREAGLQKILNTLKLRYKTLVWNEADDFILLSLSDKK